MAIACCLLLVWCGEKTTAPTEQEITHQQIGSLSEEWENIIQLYASLTCFVADANFAEENWYTNAQDIYTAYWFVTAEWAWYKMNSFIVDKVVRNTLNSRIEKICPWAVSEEKRLQIVDQLWKDAL